MKRETIILVEQTNVKSVILVSPGVMKFVMLYLALAYLVWWL